MVLAPQVSVRVYLLIGVFDFPEMERCLEIFHRLVVVEIGRVVLA